MIRDRSTLKYLLPALLITAVAVAGEPRPPREPRNPRVPPGPRDTHGPATDRPRDPDRAVPREPREPTPLPEALTAKYGEGGTAVGEAPPESFAEDLARFLQTIRTDPRSRGQNEVPTIGQAGLPLRQYPFAMLMAGFLPEWMADPDRNHASINGVILAAILREEGEARAEAVLDFLDLRRWQLQNARGLPLGVFFDILRRLADGDLALAEMDTATQERIRERVRTWFTEGTDREKAYLARFVGWIRMTEALPELKRLVEEQAARPIRGRERGDRNRRTDAGLASPAHFPARSGGYDAVTAMARLGDPEARDWMVERADGMLARIAGATMVGQSEIDRLADDLLYVDDDAATAKAVALVRARERPHVNLLAVFSQYYPESPRNPRPRFAATAPTEEEQAANDRYRAAMIEWLNAKFPP